MVCVQACTHHRDQKRASRFLKLVLQIVSSLYLGAGNQTSQEWPVILTAEPPLQPGQVLMLFPFWRMVNVIETHVYLWDACPRNVAHSRHADGDLGGAGGTCAQWPPLWSSFGLLLVLILASPVQPRPGTPTGYQGSSPTVGMRLASTESPGY